MGTGGANCQFLARNPYVYDMLVQPYFISIPKTALPGDPLGGWYVYYLGLNNSTKPNTFTICTNSGVAYSHWFAQSAYYLWVAGTKPSDVYNSPDVANVVDPDDGKTYTVWTTDALSNIGVGFILRWRVAGAGSNRGAWLSPTAPWTTFVPSSPSNDGMLFYQANGMDWATGTDRVFYDVEVAWRYVMVKPFNLASDQLNVTQSSNTTNLVALDSRESTYPYYGNKVTVTHTVNFRIPPSNTCTTPLVQEGTVSFAVNTVSFPNNQWGEAVYKDFTLTFKNCPRVNVKYYVHANGNRWVDSNRGVVGVQDSVPGASNPITGNPRGFAVRLQHRMTANHQHTGGVYIHPDEVANPLSLPDNTQSYTRNWQGAGASNGPTGVTHTIPMRAYLVRTGSSSQQQIQPGPFNTSVIVVIAYP